MTTPDRGLSLDRLDAAIDHVAARMVTVPDDGEMTLRIVSALPERTSRLRWLMPQLAAIGAIVIAALVWTTRHNTAPATATWPSEVAPMVGLANAVTENEPGTASRTLPFEGLKPLESASARTDSRELRRDLAVDGQMEPAVRMASLDHERALLSIEAVAALVVPSLSPVEIPATELLTIAPIHIRELPMTADSFSQQK